MKKLLPLLLLIAFSLTAFAQKEKYSRAKIHLDSNDKTLKRLSSLGIAVDHGEHKKNTYYISDFSEREIAMAKNNGYTVDILIDDVATYYSDQNKGKPVKKKEETEKSLNDRSFDCTSNIAIVTPTHFQLGSMGGYYTYTELLAILDDMVAQFPNLITAKQAIGTFTSVEGRPIYWLKISDNPTADENEPEILYTALHHAREPASLSQTIFYMYYLLEHYGSDPEITALVNNTEMYFIPCVNPDGYVYNETTDPNGGGMWRKNRRDNNDGTYGIDLNRNYGFNWGYDNYGSSPSTNDETYRGPSAFSEPETQAMKWFCEQHQFKMGINYHTYGNDLIYPWGYIENLYTPDSAVFVNHTKLMTSQNHFLAGTGNQTVQYVTNGDSDDWAYGEQGTKPKILSMTPEVGAASDGFWPPQENIVPICENSLWQNIYGAELIGKYADAKDVSPSNLSQINGYLNYSVQRLGLDSPATYTVSIIPADSWIVSAGSPKTYSTMSLLETRMDSISYTLNASITPGQTFQYVLRVNNGLYDKNDTITKIYGQGSIAYSNNGSSISGYTSAGGNWGISTVNYVSAPSSITDSPTGNYNDNTQKTLQLNTSIDLNTAISATLKFWTRWEVEAKYDYVEIMASNDGGSSWTPLCGKYTKPGSSDQDYGMPLYDGQQLSWVREEISLNDYLGSTISLRFKLVSDQGVNYDGFYFDDLAIETLSSVAGVKENTFNTKNIILQNIPNPATTTTTINFTLQNIKRPALAVYTVLGNLVKKEALTENQNSVTLDLSSFSNGTYFYQVYGDGYRSEVMKMVVLK
jgi:carboxypeptidase T